MIRSYINDFESELPEIIKKIAVEHNVAQFAKNPDFFDKRLEKWHQFGFVTHTKKVREVFLNELNILLKKWNASSLKFFSEKIEGAEKNELFELSILLHDLGKIIVYGLEKENREHELYSKSLLYEDFLSKKLLVAGLTKNQISYIAECIETHDVIGKEIRDVLSNAHNLNLSYLSGSKVAEMCRAISKKHSRIKSELGIFFLCDSLGKTDIRITANTDKELLKKESEIEETLRQRNLSPELKNAVMQLPLNLKIAEIYFKSI